MPPYRPAPAITAIVHRTFYYYDPATGEFSRECTAGPLTFDQFVAALSQPRKQAIALGFSTERYDEFVYFYHGVLRGTTPEDREIVEFFGYRWKTEPFRQFAAQVAPRHAFVIDCLRDAACFVPAPAHYFILPTAADAEPLYRLLSRRWTEDGIAAMAAATA